MYILMYCGTSNLHTQALVGERASLPSDSWGGWGFHIICMYPTMHLALGLPVLRASNQPCLMYSGTSLISIHKCWLASGAMQTNRPCIAAHNA